MSQFVVAIDFDGTCVTHDYPYIGSDIGAVPVLRKLVDSGCLLILNTMRSGKTLKEAEQWFKDNNLPLYGVNQNPSQRSWTTSPKVYADLYIDDSALGIPLKTSPTSVRPFVDWVKVEELLSLL